MTAAVKPGARRGGVAVKFEDLAEGDGEEGGAVRQPRALVVALRGAAGPTRRRHLAATLIQAVARGRGARNSQMQRLQSIRHNDRVRAAGGVMWRPAHAGWLARDTVLVASALIVAVVVGAAAKVDELLHLRDDPDVRDSRGLEALHLACARGRPPPWTY